MAEEWRGEGAAPFHRSYGRRRGKKLRPGRASLMDETLARLAVPQPEPGAQLAPLTLFSPGTRAVWLEIGTGGGEHLAAQAAAAPDVGLIGCEVFENGIASLCHHIHERGLANVRIFTEDARFLLPALAEGSIARAFLLFADPWPKRRHAHRRLVSPATLDLLARLLVDGGELRIATDDMGYLRWILALVPTHPAFRWTATGPRDWRQPPADWCPTRYEAKAIAEGRPPAYLVFVRRPRQARAA